MAATVSLFDASVQSPGASGDRGVRFSHTFDAFTGLTADTFARLIEEGSDSDGLTHTFQDTAGTTQTIRFIILRVGGGSVRVLVNAGNLPDATEQAYHIAFQSTAGGDIWDLAFSTDVSGTSPYDMPLAMADVQDIRDVIDDDGGKLRVIIYDEPIAAVAPGWSGTNLTFTDSDALGVSGPELSGAGGTLAGSLSLGVPTTPLSVSGSLSGAGGTLSGRALIGPTLFDDPEHNPGAAGDVGVRWSHAFGAFESTGTGVFRLILDGSDAAGTTHGFQDQDGTATQFDSLVIRTTAQQLLVNLDRSISDAAEADYRIAFRGGSEVWDFAFSADPDGADPYAIPSTTATLTDIANVITNGGTLEAIVYDVDVANDLAGWNAATLAHDRTTTPTTPLAVSGALSGAGGTLSGSLSLGTDTPLAISGSLSGAGGTLAGALGLVSPNLVISGSLSGAGGMLAGVVVLVSPEAVPSLPRQVAALVEATGGVLLTWALPDRALPPPFRYQYSYDQGQTWHYTPDAVRQARVTLAPGVYVFRVRAQNALGVGEASGDTAPVVVPAGLITAKVADLLISQWHRSRAPRLNGILEAIVQTVRDEVERPLQELEKQRRIETAVGVWLDRIGARLGLDRPYSTRGATDPRWGFDGAGEGFDQAPFAGDAVNDATAPIADGLYRRLLRARAITLLADGTLHDFTRAVRAVDPTATVRDRRTMSVVVTCSVPWQVQMADSLGALPRSAGVLLTLQGRDVFGYDEAGVGFDQAPFRA